MPYVDYGDYAQWVDEPSGKLPKKGYINYSDYTPPPPPSPPSGGYEGYTEPSGFTKRGWWMPWQTAPGQGFIAPWTPSVRGPSGYEAYDPERVMGQVPQLTYKAAQILREIGYPIPANVRVAPATIQEMVEEAKRKAGEALTAATGGGALPKPLSYAEANAILQQLGPDYYMDYDEDVGGYTVQRGRAMPEAPPAITPYQQAQLDAARTEAERQALQDKWDREWTEKQAGATQAWQQAQLAQSGQQWEQQMAWNRQQQGAQLEAQKQERLATLRANPASWLEYASLAGTTPGIQPWMLPLMPQEYQGLQAGGALPGWQAGGASLAGMPQLTTPSRQYQARMTPASRAQYGGYEQARTGAPPEDIQWRLWSQAPPSGQFGGLSYQR